MASVLRFALPGLSFEMDRSIRRCPHLMESRRFKRDRVMIRSRGSGRHAFIASHLFHAGWRPCHAEGEGGVDESRGGGRDCCACAGGKGKGEEGEGEGEISLLSKSNLDRKHHTRSCSFHQFHSPNSYTPPIPPPFILSRTTHTDHKSPDPTITHIDRPLCRFRQPPPHTFTTRST